MAARCGVPPGLLERVEQLGLLPREADGALGAGAARRLRLLGVAHARGIDDDRLLEAVRTYGDLLGACDELASPPADIEAMRLAAQAIGLGLPPDVLLQLLRVLMDGMDRGTSPSRAGRCLPCPAPRPAPSSSPISAASRR